MQYVIGLDYGTNSVRAIVVRVADGAEVGSHIWSYARGEEGVHYSDDPNLARQHPADYIKGAQESMVGALRDAERKDPSFARSRVAGIGVDTTASTPIPVDALGIPLAMRKAFENNLDAFAWLWKDHTAADEAQEITDKMREQYPQILGRIGGAYSSEWFWSKILRCARVAPEVYDSAATWVELQDFVPAFLTGSTHPTALKRGRCAAGHKGLFATEWGGYPPTSLLEQLDPRLSKVRQTLPSQTYTIAEEAGALSEDWALNTALTPGIPVAIGSIDAHMGAVGAGVASRVLVKIMGTSTCDIAVWPVSDGLPEIPGVSGVVPESVLPSHVGLEAGQAAVGDLFNWFATFSGSSHEDLTEEASKLRAGESGLLALDWNNGNRSILGDPKLTGLVLGQTLRTRPAEVYRALIEATAFGSRMILKRLRDSGVQINEIIVCGGIPEKSSMAMQIYADVLNMPIKVSRSSQTCAMGSAMAAAVVSGSIYGFLQAKERFTGVRDGTFQPTPEAARVYDELFELYSQLHDSFGGRNASADLGPVMKRLLELRSDAPDRAAIQAPATETVSL